MFCNLGPIFPPFVVQMTDRAKKFWNWSFHRLPLLDGGIMKLSLVVLQMDPNTSVHISMLSGLDHLDWDYYCQPKRRRNPITKHFYLNTVIIL